MTSSTDIAQEIETMTLAQIQQFVEYNNEDTDLTGNTSTQGSDIRSRMTDGIPNIGSPTSMGTTENVEDWLVNIAISHPFMIWLATNMNFIEEEIRNYEEDINTKNLGNRNFILSRVRLSVTYINNVYNRYKIYYEIPDDTIVEPAILFPGNAPSNDHIYSITTELLDAATLRYRFTMVVTPPEGFDVIYKRMDIGENDIMFPNDAEGAVLTADIELDDYLEYDTDYVITGMYRLRRHSDDFTLGNFYSTLNYAFHTADDPTIIEPPPPPEAIAFPSAVISNLRITNIIGTLLDNTTLRYNFRLEAAFLEGFTIINKKVIIDETIIVFANNSNSKTVELVNELDYDTAYGKHATYRLRRLSDSAVSPITYRTTQYDFRTAKGPVIPPVIIIPPIVQLILNYFWWLFGRRGSSKGKYKRIRF